MNKTLTITIPSYNAEAYLHKGIKTMLNTEADPDIEILIIDDGSTDKTAEIADEYEKEYPDIVKAVHKENGGHGSTINKGIELARGRYFYLVDADDWVITENLIRLVRFLKQTDSDLVLTHADLVDNNQKKIGSETVKGIPAGKTIDIDTYYPQIPNIEMHNYCIKTEILRQHDIRCHEHHFYVDNEYTCYPLPYIRTVVYLDMPVYQYLIGRIGQSVSIKRRQELIGQYYDIIEYLYEYYKTKNEGMSEACRDYFLRKIAYFVTGVYSTLMSYNQKEKKEELKKFDKCLKEAKPEVYAKNGNLCVKLLRLTNFGTYWFFAAVYRIVNGIRD